MRPDPNLIAGIEGFEDAGVYRLRDDLAIILTLAMFGPALSPYELDALQLEQRLMPPSAAHWLGTDEFGRDVLSRVLNGAQSSLLMGFGATAVSLLIGVPLGLVAGYYRGWADEAIMRVVDIMISLPPIILGLLILSADIPAVRRFNRRMTVRVTRWWRRIRGNKDEATA